MAGGWGASGLGNAHRPGTGPQTRNKSPLSPIRSLLQRLPVLSVQTPGASRDTAVRQACHHGFYKREGNPGSEGLRDSSQVTSKSVGRPEALPAPQPCPCVRYIFKSSAVSPSRSSIPLFLSGGWTRRNRERKGKYVTFTGEKPHESHVD
ncbi:hypothetical protein HJG60_010789 [Phyllostomus discolor]|uniref:Uncharacterized protein n=1 Tax=Phyllostomus discolor TaxID=89673 RepID=A0A834AGZ6_9CHIR|nr:hypothetical protein HJG60_010789 [Phyllostomus discolor]